MTPDASASGPPTAGATDVPEEPASSAAPPLDSVRVRLETVAQIEQPIALATRTGDRALYVAGRGGRIHAVVDGEVRTRPVLELEVSTAGEQGLLGLAFSPDGRELYVSYTNPAGDSRVDAYPMDGRVAQRSGSRQLLAVDQPYANHNGGNVVIGPDGMLYVGLGDGGSGGDPEGNAQNPGTLLGKMLRLQPQDGSAPGDNPFVGNDAYLPEIFATGVRNPWRFSFDRATGDLWIGDVGQNTAEEVSVVRGGRPGRNLGWDLLEGSQPFEGGGERPRRYVPPVIEYPTGDGNCAVTGGYVYRGRAIPDLQGAYLYADFCGGWVRAARVRGRRITDEAELLSRAGSVASFGEDQDGELYVLSLDGTVSRIVGR